VGQHHSWAPPMQGIGRYHAGRVCIEQAAAGFFICWWSTAGRQGVRGRAPFFAASRNAGGHVPGTQQEGILGLL
jgi:hypothetical protein